MPVILHEILMGKDEVGPHNIQHPVRALIDCRKDTTNSLAADPRLHPWLGARATLPPVNKSIRAPARSLPLSPLPCLCLLLINLARIILHHTITVKCRRKCRDCILHLCNPLAWNSALIPFVEKRYYFVFQCSIQ